jgi:hypothetical protein
MLLDVVKVTGRTTELRCTVDLEAAGIKPKGLGTVCLCVFGMV